MAFKAKRVLKLEILAMWFQCAQKEREELVLRTAKKSKPNIFVFILFVGYFKSEYRGKFRTDTFFSKMQFVHSVPAISLNYNQNYYFKGFEFAIFDLNKVYKSQTFCFACILGI